ncbi:MAG: methyl-accepting chemotaxis protein [Ruminococcus sp.]|nr:methyl-accepting chemotaxis protein [Ruminococcus sp.]MCM1380805.1 methyl-accepting chemotaxis protein [Muribaculaceae bacterium]MCM1479642.1 methyl-accepting chemotaxis protein [Muribaculaceae bacterium]
MDNKKETKKGKSLRKKILFQISTMVVAVLFLMTAITCVIVGRKYQINAKDQASAVVKGGVSTLEGWLTNKQALVGFMGQDVIVNGYAGDRETCRTFLADCTKRDSDIFETYMGFAEDKSIIFGSGYEPPADYDPTSRSWYKAALESAEPIITAPYTDVQSNRQVITCAVRVQENGQVIGVLGADIFIDYLSEVVSGIKADENGYAALLTEDGMIVCHENEEFLPYVDNIGNDVMTAFADTSENFVQPEEGEFVYFNDYNGEKVRYCEQTIPATGWKLGYMLNSAEFNKPTVNLIITMVIMACVFNVLISAGITIMLKMIFAPMEDIAKNSNRVANGELDVSFNYAYNDEIGTVCRAIENNNRVVEKYIFDIEKRLEAISRGDFTVYSDVEYIGGYEAIKVSLDKISKALKNVFAGIEVASAGVFGGAGEVSDESSKLSEAVSRQNDLIEEIASGMQFLSEKIDNNVSRTDSAKNTSHKAAKAVEEGNSKMKQLLEAMEEISDAAEQMQNIIETMGDISFQTNILALNASIEAAKAGMAGRGFAVVADEVRTLAGKSSVASNQTAQLIEQTVHAVNRGMEVAKVTSESLDEVVVCTREIDSIIVDINSESYEQRACVDGVNTKVGHVSDFVNTSAASSEECAAASQELNSQATELKNLLDDFKNATDKNYTE